MRFKTIIIVDGQEKFFGDTLSTVLEHFDFRDVTTFKSFQVNGRIFSPEISEVDMFEEYSNFLEQEGY